MKKYQVGITCEHTEIVLLTSNSKMVLLGNNTN